MTPTFQAPSTTAARTASRLVKSLVAAAVVVGLLAACSQKTPQSQLEQAKGHLAQNESRKAIIELLNALQQDGSLAEARFLLGKALLDTGDIPGALIELNKALSLGYSADLIAPLRARALFATGAADKVISEYGKLRLRDAASDASLQAQLAAAYASRGNQASTRAALDAALQRDPKNPDARALDIRLIAATGKLDAALAATEVLLKEQPELARAWLLKAELLRSLPGSKDEDVISAYSEALKRDSRSLPAVSGLVSLNLARGNVKAAKEQYDALSKVHPNHPERHYLATLIALDANDLKAAQEGVQAMLKTASNSPRAQHLAGIVAFRRGVYPQAQVQLARALQSLPDNGSVRLLLARSYLRGGDPSRALNTLQPLLNSTSLGADVLNLAAESSLELGNSKNAENFYRRAVAANPNNFSGQTALAVLRLKSGDESGADDLRGISAKDSSTVADMALISSMLSRNDAPRALAAIDALERKEPGRPVAPSLRGRVYLQQGNLKEAQAAYAESLKRTPTYLPAALALAGIDAGEGRFDAAIATMDRLLAADASNVQARLAVIALRARAGAKSDEVVGLLQKAITQHRDSVEPRLALVSEYLRVKKSKEALAVAREAAATFPDVPRAHELLGGALAMNGDINQAMQAYTKMSTLAPGAALPHDRLGQLYVARGETTAAMGAFRRALELQPDYLPAQIQLTNALAAIGRYGEARALSSKVQQQRAADPTGWMLAANADLLQKNWSSAIANLEQALKRGGGTATAIKMHRTLLAAGRSEPAAAFKTQWLKDHQKDAGFMMYLVDQQLTSGEFAAAEAQARQLIELEPSNPIALNNLAWAIHRRGHDGALAYAERALKLAPDSAPLLDTMASIQAQAGDLDKAIELQKRAVASDVADPGWRLQLAKYLAKKGAVREARAELKQLADLGKKFPRQNEVRQLMGTL